MSVDAQDVLRAMTSLKPDTPLAGVINMLVPAVADSVVSLAVLISAYPVAFSKELIQEYFASSEALKEGVKRWILQNNMFGTTAAGSSIVDMAKLVSNSKTITADQFATWYVNQLALLPTADGMALADETWKTLFTVSPPRVR